MSRKQKLSNFGWLFFGVRPKNPKKIGLKVQKMVALYKLISPIKINLNLTEKCDRPEMNRANDNSFK